MNSNRILEVSQKEIDFSKITIPIIDNPFIRDDLRPVQNTWLSKLNHWRLTAALSGYEFYVSRYAFDSQGKRIPGMLMIMESKEKDQSEAFSKRIYYSQLLTQKYKECMLASGIPENEIRMPPYYGCLPDFYPEYDGKVNEQPFFEYLHQLEEEIKNNQTDIERD